MRSFLLVTGLSVFALFTAQSASAQWTQDGDHLYWMDGNVGIGVDNPVHALHVRSSGVRAIYGLAAAASGATFGVSGQANSPTGRGVFGLANAGSGVNYAIFGRTNSPNGYASYLLGGRNYMEGRLGLGVPAPTQKLDVNGNIKTNGWIGTNANAPVILRSRDMNVLRIAWAGNAEAVSPNVVAGFDGNFVAATSVGATIGGGGYLSNVNSVTAAYFGTVSGGARNVAQGNYAVIAGGLDNLISSASGTISGGVGNRVSGIYANIGGGQNNLASGSYAVVPGGSANTAAGNLSFAAGFRAKANHVGAFVWGDTTAADVASTAPNQFIVRATNGIWLGAGSAVNIPAGRFINTSSGAHLTNGGAWVNASSRELKENFEPVDGREVLARVSALPITRWNYKAEHAATVHLGPMAEDFAATFGLGADDASIATVDASGVALAAIQGLHQIVQEKDREIATLNERIAKLEAMMAKIAGGDMTQ